MLNTNFGMIHNFTIENKNVLVKQILIKAW